MEIFYEVRKLFSDRSNRSLVFTRLQDVLQGEVRKCLWIGALPKIEAGEPGEPTDAWGSLATPESPADTAQLMTCLLAVSRGFPDIEIHVRADQFPGFVLNEKIEIVANGQFGRFSKALTAYCAAHPANPTPWEFLVDQRIWNELVKKNLEQSENQILTTRLARALAFARSERLKAPFLGFPLDYPGMEKRRKELKIPAELAERVTAACTLLDVTKQDLTDRGIYSGLL